VFTARYAMSPYIKQTRFAFRRFNKSIAVENGFLLSLNFMNRHLHFLITLVSAEAQVSFQCSSSIEGQCRSFQWGVLCFVASPRR
jgi:hypothetical protein